MKKAAHRGRLAETWHQLKKNKFAIVGLIIVIFVLLVAVFALVDPRIKSQFSGQSRRKKQSLPDTKAAEKDSEAVLK